MPTKPTHRLELDDLDLNIISALSTDAETSHKELAKRYNVSPGTIHFRVLRMKDNGILGESKMKVNLQSIGLKVTAFVGIYLQNGSKHDFVVAKLQRIREVVRVHTLTGQFSLLAEVVCTDREHLRSVLYDQVMQISGVDRTESMISLQEEFTKDIHVPYFA
ncbi:Lrp/AsnC ligand binding domain-containing protein [Chitinophaga sp. NPDC101104]|uniref:Lrp/AsnC ligand binding domain-containing protein n=1 Tax=Chitinophaga sp. NPDC101104 TaxID=3390561 RepID=UPI003D02A402